MVVHSRAWALWKSWRPLPEPPPLSEITPSDLPVFTLVDYQARSGGHWVHITCPAHRLLDDVIAFAGWNTGLSGWLVRTGSPYRRNEVWNWILIR